MYHRELSEQAIISGFRKGDANIIREYFYGYCQAGYYIFDQRYQLSEKENLDFMSLAHQYAIYLMEHDWKPLEGRTGNSQSRGYDGRSFDACTHNARLIGRYVCTKVVRGYGLY